MKNDIRNIINFEDLTRVRSSINVLKNIPAKDSLVKLIPIEYLNQGVKVLIDGKLFIAQIDEKIPVKEEIIAEVTSTNPFLLTLNLTEKLFKNKNFLLDQVIQKFDLPNTDSIRKLLVNVIGEENILIKSKILSIIDLLKNYPVKGLEFSLLVNLIWNNNDKQKIFIKDLYENLFDEPFEQVCENLFDSLKELLFTDMPNYLNQQISNSIIYNQKNDNSKFMANMPESILGLIKTLNDYKSKNKTFETTEIDNFIFHGTKYILQKSVLKEYDFYPDFVVVKNGSELNIINYSIKKMFDVNDNVSYKVLFNHSKLPFKLTGYLRHNFMVGDMETDNIIIDQSSLDDLQKRLNQWGLNSDIKVKNSSNDGSVILTKINKQINKLVS